VLIKDIEECGHFTAMDNSFLCELLHPGREELALPYSIAHAVIKPGRESLSHRLKESSEIYYILDGKGIIYVGEEVAEVKRGQAIYIPPGFWQHIRNIGNTDLEILCIVHPFWKVEDEEAALGK
jgi:mannose-6-phosphate isomerase-like protein (cupin superfamily)